MARLGVDTALDTKLSTPPGACTGGCEYITPEQAEWRRACRLLLASEGMWGCERCTFANEAWRKKCRLCLKRRPGLPMGGDAGLPRMLVELRGSDGLRGHEAQLER